VIECSQRPRAVHAGRWIVVFAIVSAALYRPVAAFETDQYLALEVEIADSASAVNEYLNRELRLLLSDSSVDRLECRQVAPRFYRRLFGGLAASRLQDYLVSDEDIDRFPDGWSYRKHLSRSIYRKPWFPYILPLSPTIRVGEVRFGIDKLGHFFGYGRRYYKRYERLRSRGVPETQALRRTLLFGLRQERFFVGGWTDGVFSYGDLEANYQGMEMAKRFCRGDDPYLERVDGRWRQRRNLDLRDYVTPSFDESYNNNHYPKPRWKRVRPILVAEYCETFFSPAVQERMRRYEASDRPNPSKRLIAEYFAKKGLDLKERQSMSSICGRRPPVSKETTTSR